MKTPERPLLLALLLLYGAASLVHFAHNAEFLADYPRLPASWTRMGVYFAWLGLTLVGVAGWVVLTLGYPLAGLLLLALYAVGGLDSLGHYVVAPLSAHTTAMNATILSEVVAAALVLVVVIKQMLGRLLLRRTAGT